MSIKVMSHVWEYSEQKGSKLLMLLAIADFADDEGIAYPGVERLATKTRMGERNARILLRELEEEGELDTQFNQGIRTKKGSTNRYALLKYRESLYGGNHSSPVGGNHSSPDPSVYPSVKDEERKESLPKKDLADTRSQSPEESGNSEETSATAVEAKSNGFALSHQTNVPRVPNVVQPTTKPNGKTPRPTLPKATQELIGKAVMGWDKMTDYHWKLVNAETLAKHLLPFEVTDDELRNFKRWYDKRFPDAPYTNPGILLSKLDLMRQDVKSGKFKLKMVEPASDPAKPKPKKFNWHNIILYAQREGITHDEAIERLYPDHQTAQSGGMESV